MDGPAAVCYDGHEEGMLVGARSRRLALLVGIIMAAAADLAAADEQYVIWRSSSLTGFDWQPASRAYATKEECAEAIEGRKRRIATAVDFLRRIGADETLQHAVGDRLYECRPTLTGPPSSSSKDAAPQSP